MFRVLFIQDNFNASNVVLKFETVLSAGKFKLPVTLTYFGQKFFVVKYFYKFV